MVCTALLQATYNEACIDRTPFIHTGHGGHDTVNYISEAIPARVQSSLRSLLVRIPPTSLADLQDPISRILRDAIIDTDRTLTSEFARLFPQNADALARMSDRTVNAILNSASIHNVNGSSSSSGGTPLALKRCMQGSTALMTLVDPSGKHMWMANLGDCRAGECQA